MQDDVKSGEKSVPVDKSGHRPNGHTKGPWHWDADLYAVVEGIQRWRYRVVAMGRTIMQTYYTESERGQAAADTRLAAAAPDLLEALQGMYADQVDYLTRNHLGGMDNHWMKAARAALARARGDA